MLAANWANRQTGRKHRRQKREMLSTSLPENSGKLVEKKEKKSGRHSCALLRSSVFEGSSVLRTPPFFATLLRHNCLFAVAVAYNGCKL